MAFEETRVVAADDRDDAEIDAWLFAGMFLVRFVDNNLVPIIFNSFKTTLCELQLHSLVAGMFTIV